MDDRTAVVTGATKGLGYATALAFANAGWHVLGLYAKDDVAAEKLRADLCAINSQSKVIKHDVSEDNNTLWDHPRIVEAKRLVLVNNAWPRFSPQPIHTLRWNDLEAALNIGLKGAWLCSQGMLRPMARAVHGGVIVNVSSSAACESPPKGFGAYVTAKYALRGLTVALAAECGSKRIRVFSVSPGFMSTSMTATWDDRITSAIRASGPTTDPILAGQRIRELVEDPTVLGRGEDYPMPLLESGSGSGG